MRSVPSSRSSPDVQREPLQRVNEFEAVVGRRGGKTTAMAALATYLAACCDHSDALARGETGVLLCVAQDSTHRQEDAGLRRGQSHRQPDPAPAHQGPHAGRHRADQQHHDRDAASIIPKLRGPTYIGIIADELAFWFTECDYANPDVEVLAAARPGLLTTGGPLIMASSPTPRWACFGTPSNGTTAPMARPRAGRQGHHKRFQQHHPAERDRPRAGA